MKTALALSVFLLMAFGYGGKTHVTTNASSIDTSVLFIDRTETEKWLAGKAVPALGVAYIKNGRIEIARTFGQLNEEGDTAYDDAIFNVASLAKSVTALITLKLVNEGKWDLDEPLYLHWLDPDLADDPRHKLLTTRHILSHTSGFPNWRHLNRGGKLAFDFEPGSRYQYSGEGFEYLRKALESKLQIPFAYLARDLVFAPLQMNDTRFFWDDSMNIDRFARGHSVRGKAYSTFRRETPNAADDLLTTVVDFSRFMLHVMNGARLKPELFQEMISEHTRIKPGKYWGLSWWVDENVKDGENVLVNGGDDQGAHAIAFMFPESKEGLLILTNSDNGTDLYIPTVLHFLGATGQRIIDIETK